jgi:putative Mg2+ transporter-C (MgtC) family protein
MQPVRLFLLLVVSVSCIDLSKQLVNAWVTDLRSPRRNLVCSIKSHYDAKMNLHSLGLGQWLFRKQQQQRFHSYPSHVQLQQQNRGRRYLHDQPLRENVFLFRKHWIYAVVIMTVVVLYPTYSAHAMDALHAGWSMNHAATIRPALQISAPMSVFAELRLTWRLVYAGILGAILGNERRSRSSHQSAGVRTMALVSLGAAMFTLSSMYGFHGIGGRYDPSRMASNVASGVGFIGAGVITTSNGGENQPRSVVHGLTTAAAIWLSAAVGVAVGVGLPFLSTAACLLTILVLRVGRGESSQSVSMEERYNKPLHQYVEADPMARNVREQPQPRHHQQQRLQENYRYNHTSDGSHLSRDNPPMVSDELLLLQTQSSDKANLTFESMEE